MARLARASLGDAHYPLYSQREFIWNGVRQSNRNPLLGRVPGVDGLKTGQTRKAGYCLVASAQRAGTRVIAAVLGARSEAARARGTARLLDYGFQAFAGEALVNQNEAPRTRPIRTGGAR